MIGQAIATADHGIGGIGLTTSVLVMGTDTCIRASAIVRQA
jgi:hypothetical protein